MIFLEIADKSGVVVNKRLVNISGLVRKILSPHLFSGDVSFKSELSDFLSDAPPVRIQPLPMLQAKLLIMIYVPHSHIWLNWPRNVIRGRQKPAVRNRSGLGHFTKGK